MNEKEFSKRAFSDFVFWFGFAFSLGLLIYGVLAHKPHP